MLKSLIALALTIYVFTATVATAQPSNQCVSSAVAGGTANAITIPQLPCSATTTLLVLSVTATNTTAATLQMLGGGLPLPVRLANGSAVQAGQLTAGSKVLLTYTGSSWDLLSAAASGLSPSGAFYALGNALFPVYAVPAVTTATSTNGSPTITVTSAAGIDQYDLITSNFATFGTYVVSVVGTTVTMSANATLTNVSPTAATFGMERWSANNTALTNTLGAQNVFAGTAAQGADTWLSQYSPAVDFWSTMTTISPIGQTAITKATRSSDNAFAGSSTITDICYVTADNTTTPFDTWCSYLESHLPNTAAQGFHIQTESSVVNFWTNGDANPYNINPAISARNLRLDNGKGPVGPTPMTAAMDIVNNGGTYRSGIIFHSTAFDYTGPRSYAPAIAMAAKQAHCWYSDAGGDPAWCLWADEGSPKRFRMTDVFGNKDFLSIDQSLGVVVLGELDNLVTMNSILGLKPYTVGTLPTCNVARTNTIAVVSDATAPTYNAALVGTGAVRVPVFCDGSAWTSH